MNADIQTVYARLKQDTIELHFRWKIFRQIFASAPEDTLLLNERGSHVFFLLQHLLLENVALALSKLTDPSRLGRNRNLSVASLIDAISATGEQQLADVLQNLLAQLKDHCKKFRLLRNKRIAHADYGHAVKIEAEPLPGISRADVEAALTTLRAILHAVEKRYLSGTVAYNGLLTALGADGSALLGTLREAKAFRDSKAQQTVQADGPASGGSAA